MAEMDKQGRVADEKDDTLKEPKPEDVLEEEREANGTAILEPDACDDGYPDGGLRGWLVVLGVRAGQHRLWRRN